MDSPIIRLVKLKALNDKGQFANRSEERPSVKKSRAPKKAKASQASEEEVPTV
jgi:hypothetical protein